MFKTHPAITCIHLANFLTQGRSTVSVLNFALKMKEECIAKKGNSLGKPKLLSDTLLDKGLKSELCLILIKTFHAH